MTRARATTLAVAALALLLCVAWFYLTSSLPDGLQSVAAKLGFAHREAPIARTPMADYRLTLFGSPIAGRIAAALAGVALSFAAAWVIGRLVAQKRRRSNAGHG